MWLQKQVVVRQMCIGMLLAIIGLAGCDGNPGRIRVDHARLVGIYEAQFRNGQRERLELNGNGTYVQDFISKTQPFQHTGQWHIENHLLGGSDVVLAKAIVGEGEEKNPLGVGDCRLNAHDHSGKVALARNEAMDWYYERVQ
jgi:hypothetical protein